MPNPSFPTLSTPTNLFLPTTPYAQNLLLTHSATEFFTPPDIQTLSLEENIPLPREAGAMCE